MVVVDVVVMDDNAILSAAMDAGPDDDEDEK